MLTMRIPLTCECILALFAADIPKTRNAKVMQCIVRAAFLDEKLGDIFALENPQALDDIRAHSYANELTK